MYSDQVFQAREKSKELSKNYYHALQLEYFRASIYSKDVVKNEEEVIRAFVNPTHVEPNGNLKASAYDDALTHGLSVDRLKYSSLVNIYQASKKRAKLKDPKRELVALKKASINDIRACTTDSYSKYRLFGVYDTALNDNIAHAEICAINRDNIDNAQKNILRRKLQKIFQDIQLPNDNIAKHPIVSQLILYGEKIIVYFIGRK